PERRRSSATPPASANNPTHCQPLPHSPSEAPAAPACHLGIRRATRLATPAQVTTFPEPDADGRHAAEPSRSNAVSTELKERRVANSHFSRRQVLTASLLGGGSLLVSGTLARDMPHRIPWIAGASPSPRDFD